MFGHFENQCKKKKKTRKTKTFGNAVKLLSLVFCTVFLHHAEENCKEIGFKSLLSHWAALFFLHIPTKVLF